MEHWELVAREAIRDSIAQYTHAGDRFLLREFAETFCDDGVLEVRGNPPVQGRDAIVEWLGGGTAGGGDDDARAALKAAHAAAGVRRIVRHNVTNVRFESVTETEAAVSSYFTVFTEVGLDHLGRYRDRFVPAGDRWLLAHRYVTVDWRSERSTFPEQG